MKFEANLNQSLLVASPMLDDPIFARTVIYLDSYSDEGAEGIIINQPLSLKLKKILAHLDIKTDLPEIAEHEVLMGGPIGQDKGFVLHYDEAGELVIENSTAVLRELSETNPEHPFLVTLGYSAWEPGQLEQELANDDWFIAPLDPRVLFQLPYEQRWLSTGKLLGVDFNNFSGITGNA